MRDHNRVRKNNYQKTGRRFLSGFLSFMLAFGSVLGTPMSALAATPMLSGSGAAVRSDNVTWSQGRSRVSVSLDPRTIFLASKEALQQQTTAEERLKDVLSELEDKDGNVLMGNMELYEVALPEDIIGALGEDAFLRVFVSPTSIEYGPGNPAPVKQEELEEVIEEVQPTEEQLQEAQVLEATGEEATDPQELANGGSEEAIEENSADLIQGDVVISEGTASEGTEEGTGTEQTVITEGGQTDTETGGEHIGSGEETGTSDETEGVVVVSGSGDGSDPAEGGTGVVESGAGQSDDDQNTADVPETTPAYEEDTKITSDAADPQPAVSEGTEDSSTSGALDESQDDTGASEENPAEAVIEMYNAEAFAAPGESDVEWIPEGDGGNNTEEIVSDSDNHDKEEPAGNQNAGDDTKETPAGNDNSAAIYEPADPEPAGVSSGTDTGNEGGNTSGSSQNEPGESDVEVVVISGGGETQNDQILAEISAGDGENGNNDGSGDPSVEWIPDPADDNTESSSGQSDSGHTGGYAVANSSGAVYTPGTSDAGSTPAAEEEDDKESTGRSKAATGSNAEREDSYASHGGKDINAEIAADLGIDEEVKLEQKLAKKKLRESVPFFFAEEMAAAAASYEDSILLQDTADYAEDVKSILSYEMTGEETFWILAGTRTGEELTFHVSIGDNEIIKKGKIDGIEGDTILYRTPFSNLYTLHKADGDGVHAEVVSLAGTRFLPKHNLANNDVSAEDVELSVGAVSDEAAAYAEAGTQLRESGVSFDGFSLYDISFLRDEEEYEPKGKGRIVDVTLNFSELPGEMEEEEIISYSIEHLITDAFGSVLEIETVAKAESEAKDENLGYDGWFEVPTASDSTDDSYFAVTESSDAAACFTVDSFSYYAFTYEAYDEPGVDVSDHPLVEVEESPDEELLQEDALSPGTLRLIGLAGGTRNTVKSSQKKLMKSSSRMLLGAEAEGIDGGDASENSSGADDGIPTEGPVTVDGMVIEKVSVKWLSHSTGEDEPAGKGTLALSSDTNSIGNQQFQLDFALSGKDDHEAGAVEIIFPAYLWLDRYGNEPGYLTLSVPESPETGADFAWRRVGNSIVITNVRKISAASKVMIQGTFRSVKPADMVDINEAGTTESAAHHTTESNLGHSNPFNVIIGVTTQNSNYIALKSNTIDATIDTHTEAASATKSAFNTTSREYYTYHTVDAAKKANLPAEFTDKMEAQGKNLEDYSYIRWYVSGSATGSQPFLMTFTDSYNGTVLHYKDALHKEYDTLNVDGLMLGVQGALVWDESAKKYVTGNVVSEDFQNISAVLYDGYDSMPKSAYVWTAYEKADFPVQGDEYSVTNGQVVTVKGWDDQEVSTKDASATVAFRLPITYTMKKNWIDDENSRGRRPERQFYEFDYIDGTGRHYGSKTLEPSENEAENWQYTWNDEGKNRQYDNYELGFDENYNGRFKLASNMDQDINPDTAIFNPKTDYFYHLVEESKQYDEKGNLIAYDDWFYRYLGYDYDSDTHTKTYRNVYKQRHVTPGDGFIHEIEAGIHKYTNTYTNNTLMWSGDRALNVLRRGDDVIVDYTVYGYGERGYGMTSDGLKNFDSYITRKVRLELEDNYGADTKEAAKNNTFLFDNELRLDSLKDVDIAYVTLAKPSYKRVQFNTATVNWTLQPVTSCNSFPDEEVWGYNAEAEEWVHYATASVDAGNNMSVVPVEGSGATVSGTTVTFPDHVFKVKTVMTLPAVIDQASIDSRIDGVRMEYRIGVRLNGKSELIRERLEAIFEKNDYGMCSLENFAVLNTFDADDQLLGSLMKNSKAWLHGRNHRVAVRQEKSFRVTENDLIKRELKVHSTVTMTQQSNILENTEYWEARRDGLIPSTESGTWYDLLPLGILPDVDSVRLTNGDRITDAYTIPNYKDSGRVMLVVKADVEPHVSYTSKSSSNPYYNDITYPKEGYKDVHTLEFDAYYAWDEARLYGLGKNVRNVAAYEADENALGNIEGWRGEPDDPQKNHNQRAMDAVGDDKILMTGLHPERTEEHHAFVYSGDIIHTEELDFQAATELRKYVTKDGLGIWTTGRTGRTQVELYEGDFYTYMLYVASDSETTTKNIIMLDSLETYVPTEDDDDDYKRGRWQGLFDSLDVSGLEELGIAPVIYYNTSEMDLNVLKGDAISEQGAAAEIDDPDRVIKYLQDPANGWTTSMPSDRTKVRSIAVDLRHKTDGSDFELLQDENLYFTVRMRARVYDSAGTEDDPFNADEELRREAENNDYAFNNVYMGCTQIDPVGRPTHSVIHHNYVRVGIIPFELKVKKIWDDAENNDGLRPNQIIVYPLGNGERMYDEHGNVIKLVLNEGNKWEGTIAHLIRYDDKGNWISYTFEEETDDAAYEKRFADDYTMSYVRVDNDITVTNKHVPATTSISFEKIWVHENAEDKVNMPDSITVRLMSDDSGDGTGTPVFTGKTLIVKPDKSGNWKASFTDLPMYTNPSGVSGRAIPIRYSVEEESVYKYLTEYAVSQEGETVITNTYYPFGDLLVKKAVDNVTEASKNKEFTFTLVLKDKDGNELTEKYEYTITAADGTKTTGTIGNGGTFTLKGGEEFLVKDIPSESYYEVAEAETAGFELISSSNTSNTIRAGSTREAFFKNRYTSSGRQTLSLTKTLTGREMVKNQFWFELEDLNESSQTYKEVIATTAADAEGKAVFGDLKYTEADDGKTFHYMIRETNREKPGYTYDIAAYYVDVAVKDVDGTGKLVCTPTYFTANTSEKTVTVTETDPDTGETVSKEKKVIEYSKGSETVPENIKFANEYHAEGEITLRAWKQLKGSADDFTPGTFQFDLIDAASKETIATGYNDAKGTVIFHKKKTGTPSAWYPYDKTSTLKFDEKDIGKTYFYVAKEKTTTDYSGTIQEADPKVTYSEQLRGYEISIADNGDGTLAITQKNVTVTESEGTYIKGAETTELPIFENELKPGNALLTKITKWAAGDEPDGNKEFDFTLTLVGDELPKKITVAFRDGAAEQQAYTAGNAPTPLTEEEKQPKEVELTITSPEGTKPVTGVYSFKLKAGQSLFVKDIPAGIAYQFQEEIPSGWTLEFENVAGLIQPLDGTPTAKYTNTYAPGTATATFVGSKRLDGTAPAAQKFAFELIDDTEGSATKGEVLETLWNHASGYVLFDQVYKKAGTYHYIMRELPKLIDSVTYDADGKPVFHYVTDEDELRKIEFDERTYGITVVVTETGEGTEKTLSAAVTYDKGNPVFENKSRPGSLQIKKVGKGLTEAGTDTEFTFKIRLTNDAGMPLTESGSMFWYADVDPDAAEPEPVPTYTAPETEETPAENSEDAQTAGQTATGSDSTAQNQIAPLMQTPALDPGILRSLKASPMSPGNAVMLAAAPLLRAATSTVKAEGIFNDTYKDVMWTLYTDGLLVIEPVNGVSGKILGTNEKYDQNDAAKKLWPWNNYRTDIISVQVKGKVEVVRGLRCMFQSCSNLKYADLSGLYTDPDNLSVAQVFCTSFIFENCKLEYLDVSNMIVTKKMYDGDNYAVIDHRGLSSSYLKCVRFGSNYYMSNMPGGPWTNLDTGVRKASISSLGGSDLAGTWVRDGYSPHITIQFDGNGGQGSMEPQQYQMGSGTEINRNAFLSDLEFTGWSTDKDAVEAEYEDGGAFTGAAYGGQIITLYAIWKGEDSFLINYDANGGYVRTQWQRVNRPTDSVTLPTPTHPSNYDFIGWNTKQDGTGKTYLGTVIGEELNTEPGKTLKLYAQFVDPAAKGIMTVEHYQQKADLSEDYGTPYAVDRIPYEIDPASTIDTAPDKREFKGFKEGYMKPGQETEFPHAKIKGGFTIKYYYDRTKYTITFDPNGGTGEMDDIEMIGGIGKKLPVSKFAKENAIFVGWNTQADGKGINYGDGQTVNSIGEDGQTVTLYAQYFSTEGGASLEPTNGEYTVKCKAGEIITFPMVPAGTKYEIEEVDLPDGWKLERIRPESGDVKSAERVDITVTNSYSTKGSVSLMAHKRLPGETVESGQFSFQLFDMNGAEPKLLETVTNSSVDTAEQIADPLDEDGGTIANPWYGSAPVRFETIDYDKQGIYTYKIKELPGSDTSIKYDSHEETVTVLVTDQGNGRLKAETIYDRDQALFTNLMSDGDLKVSKIIRNATANSKDALFKFILYLYDSSGNEITETYEAEISNGTKTTVTSGGYVEMKGGENFIVKGLPHKSTYAVGEVPAAGFEKVSESGTEGTIQAGQTQEASITNAYTVKTQGLAVIKAEKRLRGRELAEGEFIFRLYNSSGELLDEKSAAADGTVTFKGLTYGSDDDGKRYVYFIDEVKGRYMTRAEAEAAGIEVTEDMRVEKASSADDTGTDETGDGDADSGENTDGEGSVDEAGVETGTETGTEEIYLVPDSEVIYDTHREQVGVEISDNGDGSMTASVIYDEDGAVFENIINHGDLKIEKTVINATARTAAQQFRFTIHLEDAEGNEIAGLYRVSYSNGTAGSVSSGQSIILKHGESAVIERLPYDAHYEVTEEALKDFELTGETGSTGTIPPGDTVTASFENTNVQTTGLKLKATKQLKNEKLEANVFNFELEDRTTGSAQFGKVIDTAMAAADGSISFRELKYSLDDVGKTFTYIIREIAGTEELMQYDTHEETVQVIVELDSEGLISARAVFDVDGAVFVNEKLNQLPDPPLEPDDPPSRPRNRSERTTTYTTGFPPGQGPQDALSAAGGDVESEGAGDSSGVLGALRDPIGAIQEVLGASRLPQTGMLWWPVPVMMISGAGLIIFGRKKRKEEEEE